VQPEQPSTLETDELLDLVYGRRFAAEDAQQKDAIWAEICRYLQRWVPVDGAVLDLACDRGDFIRNIQAREKWGSDLRDVSGHLGPDVRFVRADGLQLARHVPGQHFAVVFMSNYLEHLADGDAVVEQLRVAATILKPGGRVVVLQPNIRLTGLAYWDFIDHKVALTDRSLVEAAEMAGFETETVVKRFLPYTTKSRFPQTPRLVRAYLRFPPAWLLFGKQTLFVGRRL
jgi:SAM-dependent methyltransferase